jgi:hypothetical protein
MSPKAQTIPYLALGQGFFLYLSATQAPAAFDALELAPPTSVSPNVQCAALCFLLSFLVSYTVQAFNISILKLPALQACGITIGACFFHVWQRAALYLIFLLSISCRPRQHSNHRSPAKHLLSCRIPCTLKLMYALFNPAHLSQLSLSIYFFILSLLFVTSCYCQTRTSHATKLFVSPSHEPNHSLHREPCPHLTNTS